MKLGTRLLRDGVIGLTELEAALRAQVLYGGRLGTNLVELGFVDVDTLGQYLALAVGAPEATRELFEDAPAELITRFGAELAREHTAFPLRRESDHALAIAVLNPLATAALLDLETALGCAVRPYAAAEIRIFFYLEKHYDIERSARYVRTSSVPRQQGAVERHRVQGAPRVIRVEPRRARNAAAASMQPADVDFPATGPSVEPLATFEQLRDGLDAATTREDIGETLIRYGEGRFDVLVALLIRDHKAMGWLFHSVHAAASTTAVDQLSLPLADLSVLCLAHDASEPYWGPPPSPELLVEKILWSATGTPGSPGRCLVVPVMVRDRVVQLLYAHNAGGDTSDRHRRELIILAAHVGDAYLRLIRAAKAR